MKEKILDIYEKYFPFIILILFIVITSLGLFSPESMGISNIVLKTIINFNNKFFELVRDYKHIIYLIILFITSSYIFFRGETKNKKIVLIALILSLITFLNSLLFKDTYFIELEIRHIVAFPLFFIFINTLEIFLKRYGKGYIEKLILKTIKITIIYIGLIFLLAKLTGVYCITYSYAPYGFSGRFRERNAVSHIFVMVLPILLYFFHKNQGYKMLFYIAIAVVCPLLIGTKSGYFGVYTSLIIFLLVTLISYIRTKKINIAKAFIIATALASLFVINDKLYAPQFISRNLESYVRKEKALNPELELSSDITFTELKMQDKINFSLSGRKYMEHQMKWIYNHESFYIKLTGMGFYYPKYIYVLTEMDLYDILYKQGILGMSLYLYTAGYYIFLIIKNIKKNLKAILLPELLFPLSSVAMVTFASLFTGHVIYNYITNFIYALVIVFLYTSTITKTE